MSLPRVTVFSLLLLLALSTSVSAQDGPGPRADPGVSSLGLDQTIYKGLVGNVLDAIPMDPLKRLDLQRANAVISNTATGRTLAVLAGLSNPILMVVGLIWGAWAASNIKPEGVGTKLTVDLGETSASAVTQAHLVARLPSSAASGEAPAASETEPMRVSSNSAGSADEAALALPPVIKVWLPQRSSIPPR